MAIKRRTKEIIGWIAITLGVLSLIALALFH